MTQTQAASGTGPGGRTLPRGFLHPVAQLGLGVVLVTASEILLKLGADRTAERLGGEDWTGVSALGSLWVWLGIACYIASFVSWLFVLRHVPLVLAFNAMNTVHVTIPIAAALVLGEPLPLLRVAGIVVILAGVAVLAGPLARLEEKM